MLSLLDMNQRLGFGPGYGLLWTASVNDVLGVAPTVANGLDVRWTEAQFVEICRRLRAKMDEQINNYDNEL